MQKFEAGDLYRPSEQGQGFAPIQAPDITPLLRDNNRARLQEAQNFADARMADLRMEEQALKYANLLENEQVENLAQFSSSLSELVVVAAQKRNEFLEQQGLMKAYKQGMTPQASAEFDAAEQALQKETGKVYKAANDFYQEGMPIEMVKTVQNLTGWEKYGYMRGIAEMGGAQYGTFYTKAAQELQVTVGGRTFTLMEAQTVAERAAAKAAIAEQFMGQFNGMSPGLLNKYLFPAMKRWEQGDDLEWADKQRKAFEDKKESDFKDSIFTARDNPDTFGEKFIEQLDFYNNTFGNRTITNQKGFAYLTALAEEGKLTDAHIDSLEQARVIRTDTGKVDFGSNVFKRQIAELRIAASKGRTEIVRRKQNEDKVAQDEFKENYLRMEEAEGGEGVFDEKLTTENIKAWETAFPFTPVPEWLERRRSKQDVEIEAQKKMYEQRIEGDKYLTEQDFMNMHPEVRRYFTQLGVKPIPNQFALERGGKYYNLARKELNQHARTFYKLSEGEADNLSTFRFTERAMRMYQEKYNKIVRDTQDPFSAHLQALSETVEMSALDESPFSQDNALDFKGEKKATHEAETTRFYLKKHGNIKDKIPNLESSIEQLKRWKRTGKGGLPSVFLAATAGTDIDPWEFAEAQFEAYTGEELVRPELETKVQTLTPETRRLLQQYNTPARTLRASVASGGFDQLANLTGYYESKGFGDYDAMNEGGEGIGLNNTAKGSANSKDVFGRGLSEMTVQEVLDLQRQGKLFAAGRYQFIPKTLRWVIQREGLPTDVLFDKKFQDWIWAAQVRYRLEAHGSDYVPGLRNEWQGLHHAPVREIKAGVGAFKQSPFNDPQYLHPALLKKTGGK